MRAFMTALTTIAVVGASVAAQGRPTSTPSRAPSASARRTDAAAARRDAEKRRRRLDFIEAKTVSGTAEHLAERRAVGTTLLVSGDEQTTYLLLRRATSSEPEVHARWDDIVIVRSGTGAIEVGDSLVGSAFRGTGERLGGHFVKSYQIVIQAGDVVRIPAAVPHAFAVSGAAPLEYLLIKQRRQTLPIRWYGERSVPAAARP